MKQRAKYNPTKHAQVMAALKALAGKGPEAKPEPTTKPAKEAK